MTTWAVVASGQSVTQADVDRVRYLPCVAVSDGFKLAPWAKALVAGDSEWWLANPDALEFQGEKWCGNDSRKVPRITPRRGLNTNTNSGLWGLDYAVTHGASRVLLLGIDMHGTHYFGPHTATYKLPTINQVRKLKDPTPERFAFFMAQFAAYAEYVKEIEVINCSPISALKVFPIRSLDEALEEKACSL